MVSHGSTVTQSRPGFGPLDGPPEPGVALVFMGGRPTFDARTLGGGELVVGRGEPGNKAPGTLSIDDERASRNHLSVRYESGAFRLKDQASRNGTQVDGASWKQDAVAPGAKVVRVGGSLLLLLHDVRPYLGQSVEVRGEWLLGPSMQRAFEAIGRAAKEQTLHLIGESGTGKELAARHFHASTRGSAFVAVNCAGIPQGIAERLLFGAKKGAYSGADRDADGYLHAAHQGTLFLDEVGELELSVQAKLLRALETREVLPLGATQGSRVDFKLCSATHRDLRSSVASGALREDLYFRLGRPSIEIPPLRERLEEIPWHVTRAIGEVHVSFVEACLLRHWPGNVRELLREANAAQLVAAGARVSAEHLDSDAGQTFGEPEETAGTARPTDAEIRQALETHRNNVSAAARALKIHRTTLRRWIEKTNPG